MSDVNGESAGLPPAPTVSNLAIQSVCPLGLTTVDHAKVLTTAVAYAAVPDPLTHPGTACQHRALPPAPATASSDRSSPRQEVKSLVSTWKPSPGLLDDQVSAEPPLLADAHG